MRLCDWFVIRFRVRTLYGDDHWLGLDKVLGMVSDGSIGGGS